MKGNLKKFFALLCVMLLCFVSQGSVAFAEAVEQEENVEAVVVDEIIEYQSLAIGKTKTFKPDVSASFKPIWKSSNSQVASVSKKGAVKGKKVGTAEITCTVEEQVITYYVEVIRPTKSINFNKKTQSLQMDNTLKFTATVSPSTATIKDIIYESSNEAVATVDDSGVVTPMSIGTATITAKAADGFAKKVSYKVNVIENIKKSANFIAHRGLSSQAPENTLKSFQLAGESGFWGCETDVHKTKDGKFVLIHDDNLRRMCGVKKNVSNLTLSQIKGYPIKKGNNYSKYKKDKMATTIPTLEEYLEVCKNYDMVPVVEIKMSLDFNKVSDKVATLQSIESTDVDDYNMELQSVGDKDLNAIYNITKSVMGDREVVFIGFDLQTLVRLRMLMDRKGDESISLQHVVSKVNSANYKTYRKYNIDMNAYSVNINMNKINDYITSGHLVNLWVVDSLSRVQQFTGKGVTHITTNKKYW